MVGLHADYMYVSLGVRALHPDSRVATGNPPRPLPRAGLGRRARAFLLRPRTDCNRTAERLFRLTGNGSPSCAQCPVEETLEHILLQCPGYDDQRRQLFGVYGRLGLPHVSLDDLRQTMAEEDIVITGFSGYFPQADHLVEFKEKLYAGVDMVTEDDLRWPPGKFSLEPSEATVERLVDCRVETLTVSGIFGRTPRSTLSI
ncbi:hypothetical protein MTO96_042647 [Rhipicephalus appendiculatus]